jgi:aspartyl-tRNA(Asn)/glutamyl-tRNA(Gln) amidotransferase subunit A
MGQGIEPGVRAACRAALNRVESLGGTLVPIELPHASYGLATYYLIAPAECSANLARFDGIRYGRRAEATDDLLEHYERTRGEGFGPEVKRRIMLGTFALSSGYYDAYYGQAQRVRTLIVRDFAAAFAEVDVLASPTSPTVAFRLGERTADPLSMYLSDVCTIPVSLAGLPSLSIPCGLSDGLPVGLQLAGPAFSENRLFEVAHALEAAIGFDPSPPGVAA